MKTQVDKFKFKSTLMLSLLLMTSFAWADTKQEIAEARQESQIWTTYALSPYLRAHDIKVQVHDGKATLTGKVDENVNKDLAKQIALGVSGIKSVDNQILVQSDYAPKTVTRGYGEAIDDATISAGVRSRLMWSKYIFSEANTVETNNGRVTLKGTAENAEVKDFAGRLTMGTRGVTSVNNQLVVSAKPSVTNDASKMANDASHKIADSWITTKVKSNFLYSSNVSGSDIEVSTSNGAVNLKGKVSSGAERALAIELAQNVRGVKNVDARELAF